MRSWSHRVAIVSAFLTSAASTEAAQLLNLMDSPDRVLVSPRSSPHFGTSSTSILTVSAERFRLGSGTEGPIDPNTFMKTCQTGSCSFFAEMSLPSGAFITDLEVEGCDGDPAGHVAHVLVHFPSPVGDFGFISPVGDSGTVATPGCGFFPVAVAHTVNNLTGRYLIDVNLFSGTNVGFTAVRVRYNLQVSTPPGTATFNDVDTNHPQFQFIEALVAAGITAGCGSGNYCPDATLTRGQMAVFLSKALGLHFPN